MRLLLTLDEVAKIVAKELKARGLPVKEGSVAAKTHVEGQYDDARECLDGITVELEEPDGKQE